MKSQLISSDRDRRSPRPRSSEELEALPDEELDQRIQRGWDLWCDLVDELTNSGGMLPPRSVADRVVDFFEVDYFEAEAARIEALRRQTVLRRSELRQGFGQIARIR